jgi:hypothetical protein
MDNHVRAEGLDFAPQPDGISGVGPDVVHAITNTRNGEKVWIGRWFQCVAACLRTELLQPKCKPSAFEAGMSGEENAPSRPKG